MSLSKISKCGKENQILQLIMYQNCYSFNFFHWHNVMFFHWHNVMSPPPTHPLTPKNKIFDLIVSHNLFRWWLQPLIQEDHQEQRRSMFSLVWTKSTLQYSWAPLTLDGWRRGHSMEPVSSPLGLAPLPTLCMKLWENHQLHIYSLWNRTETFISRRI